MLERDSPIPLHRCCLGVSRRDVLRLGFLGVGAWMMAPVTSLVDRASASSSGVPSSQDSERVLRSIVTRYVDTTDNPWVVMHGIRAMGRRFTVGGASAIDLLAKNQLKEVGEGREKRLAMPIAVEGHADTFLKTILEAGYGLDYPITAVGRRRTVGTLLDDAKALFSYEPGKINGTADELAWSIIAFSITTPPARDGWRNAKGQQIKLREVVRYGFDTLEWACADFRKAMREGRIPEWKDRISNFTCGGTHLIYSLGVAVRYGHLGEEGRERYAREIGLLLWRLRMDLHLLDEYYKTVAKAYPDRTEKWRPYRIDSRLKFLGHAFEILSYNRLNRLVPLTAEQEREVQWADGRLAETIEEAKGLNMAELKRTNRKFFDMLIGDACHAYHGIHMVRGVNQV